MYGTDRAVHEQRRMLWEGHLFPERVRHARSTALLRRCRELLPDRVLRLLRRQYRLPGPRPRRTLLLHRVRQAKRKVRIPRRIPLVAPGSITDA